MQSRETGYYWVLYYERTFPARWDDGYWEILGIGVPVRGDSEGDSAVTVLEGPLTVPTPQSANAGIPQILETAQKSANEKEPA